MRAVVAATAVLSLSALAGCAQLPSSDNESACVPTDRFTVERTGEGTGPVITNSGMATVTFDIMDESGQVLAENQALSVDSTGAPLPIPMSGLVPGIQELLRCAQAGEDVTATIPNTEFYTAEVVASGQVAADESQYLTAHVQKVYHSAASGRIVPQQNGIPAVVNAPDGGHGVTIPKQDAPTERRVAETIQGFGETIAENDLVVVQMTAYAWSTSEVLFNSWENTTEAMVLPATPGQVYTLGDALVGQRVGSQLVVIVPAEQLAEIAGEGSNPLGSGDTVVFVIDLLGKA